MKKIRDLFFPENGAHDHVNVLDGFRGNAILILLLTHSSNWGMFISDKLNFQLAGRSGACLFFILSSFLLTRQMIHALTDNKPLGHSIKKFYIRRFLRIYPLYFLGLLALGLVTHYYEKVGMYAYPLKDIPGHLLLYKGNGIFWTVAVELKYYLGLPFLMILCYKFTKFQFNKSLLFLLAVYAPAFAIWAYLDFRHFPFMEAVPPFMMGTLIAIFEYNVEQKGIKKEPNRIFDAIGLLALLALLTFIPYYHKLLFGSDLDIKQPIYYLILGLLWSVTVVSSGYGTGFVRRIFEFAPLRFLGIIGYSVYIFHLPVLFFVYSDWLGIPQALKIYAFVAITLTIATLSYLLIERPLAILKIKYVPRS